MAAQFQITPPESFDFRNPTEWEKWIKRFERFRVASELAAKSEDSQVNMLLYCMGSEADDLLVSFGLTAEQARKYSVVKQKFSDFFNVKKNVVYERAKFFKRRQLEGELADVFINDVYKLAETCELQNLKEELITTVLVIGVADDKLSETLQMDHNLTAAQAVKKIRQAETVRGQQQLVRENHASIDVVRKKFTPNLNHTNPDASRYRGPPNLNRRSKVEMGEDRKSFKAQGVGSSNNEGGGMSSRCFKCGISPLHQWSNCPARNVTCFRCEKVGHYGRCCKSKNITVQELSKGLTEDHDYYLGEVALEICSDPWYIQMCVQGMKTTFKIDTGADVTVIGRELSDKLGLSVCKTGKKLFGAGHNPIEVVGTTKVYLSLGDQTVKQDIYVVPDQGMPLLGRPALRALNIVSVREAAEITDFANRYVDKFPMVFQGLGKFKHQYHIKINNEATPFAVVAPRRVALPLREKVKEELDKMKEEGVITPIHAPTEWCAPIVVVPKRNGTLRVCVDYTELNKFVSRERLQLPSVEESLAQLQNARWFTVLDASKGFWQIPLTQDSAPLTTFITPFGRYHFNRLPFGINSGPEHYQRQMQQIVGGLPGVVNQADDILVCGSTSEEHDQRLDTVLEKLKQNGVTLNKAKCKFKATTVKFLGHVVSEGIVQPDPEKTKAITNMPEPTNTTELRRFLGMINYLMKFIPQLAEKTQPLRLLLHQDMEWVWGAPQQEAVKKLKEEIAKQPVLALYSRTAETRILADASSYGLGGVLEQCHSGVWKPVTYASRSLNDVEKRYAQIEKEALAITWACERFRNYVLGARITIVTDHKPLVTLMSTKPVSELTARLQRMRMRLMCFDYTISHIAGNKFFVPDALSRAPVEQPEDNHQEIVEEELFVESVLRETPFSDTRLKEIQMVQEKDESCEALKNEILQGFNNKCSLFWPYRGQLTYQNGLVMYGARIFIPKVLRSEMLSRIHQGHMGIVKCRRRVKESVWWPNITRDVKALVDNCTQCVQQRQQHAEPLMPTPLPERPWSLVGVDIMELRGTHYLVVQDYYSRYLEVVRLDRLTSEVVITRLQNIFARHGVPETVRSDGGTQFTSWEFQEFSKTYGFVHITSSPKYPQSNGEAESAVGVAKKILSKTSDPNLGLLAYRATPLESGFSPAELLFGRKLRTTLPVIATSLEPQWNPDMLRSVRHRDGILKERSKHNYDKRHGAKELEPLTPGTRVWVPDLKRYGTVQGLTRYPRSYQLLTDRRTIRRNRRQLIRTCAGNEEGMVELPTPVGSMRDPNQEPQQPVSMPERAPLQPGNGQQFGESPKGQPFRGFPAVEQQRDEGLTTRSGRRVVQPRRLDL